MICLIYPYLICWISSVWLLLHIHNKSDILQATKLTLQQLSWKSASLYFVKKKKGKKKISWNSQITCKFQPPATYTLFELYHCKRQRTTEKSSRRQLPATLWQVQQLPVSVYCSGALGTVEWRCLCRTQGQRLHFGPDELLHSF